MHQRLSITIKESNIIYISNTTIDDSFKTINHSHPNLEIIYIYNGSGALNVLDKTIPLEKDNILIINPKIHHLESSNKNMSFYAIGLSNINLFTNDINNNGYYILSDIYNKRYILSLYENIYYEIQHKNKYYEDIIKNNVDNIINIISREITNLSPNNIQTFDSDVVSLIKNYINNNYTNEINLNNLASITNFSISYLCHTFKKETGYSIIDYKISKQLEEAKNLIEISDMNINQIGLLVGFNNQSYFIRKFKNKYNITPKEYRNIK